MNLRVGILSTAHMHVGSYVHALGQHDRSEIVGFFDEDDARASAFATRTGLTRYATVNELLGGVDAVVITAENARHAELSIAASKAGKHVLCEKPLATSKADGEAMVAAAEAAGKVLMTAFPCRFHPAYARLKERVRAGDIGKIEAICATNRGTCPGGWFVDAALAGGGAMIDHTVHVADLVRDLLGEEPSTVHATTNNIMHGRDTEDCAMLTMTFPSGAFVTLDSSWSRPGNFKTWGDVTMNVVGEKGVIELDMFGQALDVYADTGRGLGLSGFGSDADALMVDSFVRACLEGAPVVTTGYDGLRAMEVALAAYESVRQLQPATV